MIEAMVERCAFWDVHRDTVMACARTPDGHGGRREEVVEFGTTTSQLLGLADWLAERRVTLVGMEATGVYWKPVHWVLEGSVPEVWVINARHMRNLPGRKTDVADAIWGRRCSNMSWCGQASSHRSRSGRCATRPATASRSSRNEPASPSGSTRSSKTPA